MSSPLVSTVAVAAFAVAAFAAFAAVPDGAADPPGGGTPSPSCSTPQHGEHRATPTPGPADGAGVTSPCAAALSQAQEELGHFSDAKETWVLTTQTCRPSASASASPSSFPTHAAWSNQAL